MREFGRAIRLPLVPAASRMAAAEAACPMQHIWMSGWMQFIQPDIQMCCIGQAASAAAILLAAGTKGKRMALPNSRILIHQPATQGGGYEQVSDLEIQAREIMRMRSAMEVILARHTGQEEESIRRDIERDKVLTAEEAR